MTATDIVTTLIADSIRENRITRHHFGPDRAGYEAAKEEVLANAGLDDSTEALDEGDGNCFDAWGTDADGNEWRIYLESLAT